MSMTAYVIINIKFFIYVLYLMGFTMGKKLEKVVGMDRADKMDTEPTEPKKEIEDLDLTDVRGIGPTTAKDLREAGILSVTDLASCSGEELAEKLGKKLSTRDTAYVFIESAKQELMKRGFLERDLMVLTDALIQEQSAIKLSTGSTDLDYLLMGGIESKAMTEFVGQNGCGKTQICLTCAVMATQPREVGGLDGNVLWFDTEGTLKAERVREIAKERGFDPDKVLARIYRLEIYSSGQFELTLKEIGHYLQKYNPKLIVVDSIISLHRGAFTGMGTLADRQQRLNGMLQKLLRVSKVRNIPVIVTNQVSASPDTMFGNPEQPTGGNVLGHTTTYRLRLTKTKDGRNVTIFKSHKHPYGTIPIQLCPAGIQNFVKKEDKVKAKLDKIEDKASKELNSEV